MVITENKNSSTNRIQKHSVVIIVTMVRIRVLCVVLPKPKASVLPLWLCVRACIYNLSVWLVAAGPGNTPTPTQAHKHINTHTHTHARAHSNICDLAQGQHERAYIKDASVSYAWLTGSADRQTDSSWLLPQVTTQTSAWRKDTTST